MLAALNEVSAAVLFPSAENARDRQPPTPGLRACRPGLMLLDGVDYQHYSDRNLAPSNLHLAASDQNIADQNVVATVNRNVLRGSRNRNSGE